MTTTEQAMHKKICMIAYTNYLGDNRVRREAETLAAEGNVVCVLALKEKSAPASYVRNGVEVRELNVGKYQGKSNRQYLRSYFHFLARAFVACNRMLFRERTDAFHVHNMPNFLVLAAILPRLLGRKLILDIHDTMVETYAAKFAGTSHRLFFQALTWLLRVEEAVCCRLAHTVIAVNHIQKEALVRRGIPERKIALSLNVPDPAIFSAQKAARPDVSLNGSFKMIYHGTLAKRAGIDIAMRAVALSVSSIPHLEYHVMGAGDDLEDFLALRSTLGLEKKVTFTRGVPIDDVAAIVSKMDLGVISNRNNIASDLMLPVKMLEYICLNVPVVVPRLRTIQYYFSEDMVFYYDPEDEQSLARAIIEASSNRELRQEKAKKARAFLEIYGWEKHRYDLINLYAALWQPKRLPAANI